MCFMKRRRSAIEAEHGTFWRPLPLRSSQCLMNFQLLCVFCQKTTMRELTLTSLKSGERLVQLKGLCHPRCLRKLIITTLKSLAQLFQIPSESSGGCYIALGVNVKVYRLILKNCLYSTESDSGCRNQANLRRNTPLRKRPTGLYCACAPADIVPLMSFI